jgi:hypothetical protein
MLFILDTCEQKLIYLPHRSQNERWRCCLYKEMGSLFIVIYSIRSASVIIERRIQLHDLALNASGSISLPQTPYPSTQVRHHHLSLTSHPAHLCRLLSAHSESTPLLHPNSLNSTKLVVNAMVGTESSGTLYRDENGMWSRTLTSQWPAAKSHSLWAIGETMSSDLVLVKFFIRTKV